MKWWLVGGAVGLSLAVLADVGVKGQAAAEKETVWLSDYTAARMLARQSGKPLFVVFRCER